MGACNNWEASKDLKVILRVKIVLVSTTARPILSHGKKRGSQQKEGLTSKGKMLLQNS